MRIQWDQVDFAGGVIRLCRGRTKTGDPRMVPMIGNMDKVLLQAKADRDEYFPDCLRGCSLAWENPSSPSRTLGRPRSTRAGFADLQFHDLRRSGARNLSRAGVPERVIMSITGHKTRAMFDRYNITSESDLTEAAAKLKAYRDGKGKLDSDLMVTIFVAVAPSRATQNGRS